MKNQILFDTTDAGTIADSDKILSGLVSSSDASTLLTDTLFGGKQALDVYKVNTYAEDAAHSSGAIGDFVLAVRNDTEGSLVDTDGDYAPLQVDSSGRLRVVGDIDVSNLSEKDEDSAHVSGDTGSYVLAVRADTRPTNSNVSADGDYASLFINDSGELYVKDTDTLAQLVTIDAVLDSIKVDTGAMVVDLAAIEVEQLAQGVTLDAILVDTGVIAGDTTSIDNTLTALSKAEDAAHVSGDQGIQALAVRNDTLASLADTDGDYAPFQVDADGALYVTFTDTDEDSALANTAIANTATVVGNVATDLVGTDLASRKYAFIGNEGNKKIFVGGSGVTTASGFPVYPGSVLELRAGAAIDLHAIKTAGGDANDTRILELS